MKNLARLILFFTASFAAFFFGAVLLEFILTWVDSARIIPTEASPGQDAVAAAWKAITPALYLSILFAISYSSRRKMAAPAALIGTIVLACALTGGVSFGLNRASNLRPAFRPVSPIQAPPGLILSRSQNVIVLLRESSYIRGPRVVSIPGQPLIYQEVPFGPYNTIIQLPALSFGHETPWFIQSIRIDLSLSATEIRSRLENNLVYFAAYIFSLILLLVSLRLFLELSHWPLANLFLGLLVFRLILSLESFLNAREINTMIYTFLNGRLPSAFISPLTFSAIGTLIILCALLSKAARLGRREDD